MAEAGADALWQLDIVGSCFLSDGREVKVVTGVDDHSRFCVIAAVVERATGRAVGEAFLAALSRFGCPDQVLTDNGRQFTGRLGKPRPSEVLFERICRNGIETLLTKPRSPTTTGKIERFHQTLQGDCLNPDGPFVSVASAQTAVDAFVDEYNYLRPHQALDDDPPASRFVSRQPAAEPGQGLGLDDAASASDRESVREVGARVLTTSGQWLAGDAVEVDRVVPASGNLNVGGQQFWVGTSRVGQRVRLWLDTTTVHLSLNGGLLKTVPSRQTAVTLARLRAAGGLPAGAPPSRHVVAQPSLGKVAVEVDRVVNAVGLIGLGGRTVAVGSSLAGQRITLRLDETVAHVIAGGILVKTMPTPVPADRRGRLWGARIATDAMPTAQPVTVQRHVSCRGQTMVAGQTIQVGFAHRNTIVDITVADTTFTVTDLDGEPLTVIPSTTTKEVHRFKAYGWKTTTT